MMTGVIWFVQIVHYPLFHFADQSNFRKFEKRHQKLTSFIVMPLMLGELIGAVLLPLLYFDIFPVYFLLLNLVLVILVLLITFIIQVPLHRKLENGYNQDVVNRLVKTNAIRVILWSFKAGLMIAVLLTNK